MLSVTMCIVYCFEGTFLYLSLDRGNSIQSPPVNCAREVTRVLAWIKDLHTCFIDLLVSQQRLTVLSVCLHVI